jgi:uncharacterized membrane protein YGL010W
MRTLEDQLASYAAYHQDARNKATHFIGVPVIALSLFIPLAWPRIEMGGVAITAAMLLMAIFVLYYFLLDLPLGVAMFVAFAVLLWVGAQIASLGTSQGWMWFLVLFVGGWALQFVGHLFEGRRPALVDNLFQSIFIAPIFLAAEVFFALGYKPALHARVQERARGLRAAATDVRLTPAS